MRCLLLATLLVVATSCACAQGGYKTIWKRELPYVAAFVTGSQGQTALIGNTQIIVLDSQGKELWRCVSPFWREGEEGEFKFYGTKLLGLSKHTLLCLDEGKVEWSQRLEARTPSWKFADTQNVSSIFLCCGWGLHEVREGELVEFSL
ncbi:MAG: hypothetical protein M3R04_07130, partial [bacterium]|nr:hypothetical protein [bacterium]